MIFKQRLVLIIVTLCANLVHLLFYFLSKNNSHLLLGLPFFNISNVDIASLVYCAILFLSITILLKLFTISLIDENLTVSNFLREFDDGYKLVCFCGLISGLFMTFSIEIPHEEKIRCSLVTTYSSIFCVVVLMIKGYDEVDKAKSQDSECSIGAYWATGSVQAYYEKSLKECRNRFEDFEENNPNIKFLVKKLVLICPLSCNIEGSLAHHCEEITHIGDLKSIECDQGANYNRRLKTPVYEIYKNKGIFVAAEFPSPLGTLWGERFTMDENVKLYHRDCFLKELKEQLKTFPVLILEYDDQNPSTTVPLHRFIVESLNNHRMENSYSL